MASLNTWHLSEASGLTPPDQVQGRKPDLTAVLARSPSDRQPVLRLGRSQRHFVPVEIKMQRRGRSGEVVLVVANKLHPAAKQVSAGANLQKRFGQNL